MRMRTMKDWQYQVDTIEEASNEQHIPVVQAIIAIFRLASPRYSDHQVSATRHVSEYEKQKHVDRVSRHYVFEEITLIDYH